MNKICYTQPANLSESLNLNQSDVFYTKDCMSKVMLNNSTRSEQKINNLEQKSFNQAFQDSQLKILATDKQDLQQQISSKIQYIRNNIQDQHKKNLNQKVYSILYGTLPSQDTKKGNQQSKKEAKQNDLQEINQAKLINQYNQQYQQQNSEQIFISKKRQVEQVQLPVIQTRSQLLMQKLLDKQNRQKRSISHNVNNDYNQNNENMQTKKCNTSFLQMQQQNQLNIFPQRIIDKIQDKCGYIVFNQKIQSSSSQGEYLSNEQQENQKNLLNLQDNSQYQVDHQDKLLEIQLNQNELAIDQIISNQRNTNTKKYIHKKAYYNSQIKPYKNQKTNENVIKLKSFTQGIDNFQYSKQTSKTPPKSSELIQEQLENIQKNQENENLLVPQREQNHSNTEKLLNEVRSQSPNLSSIIQIEFPEIKSKITEANENKLTKTPLRNNVIAKKINQQNKQNNLNNNNNNQEEEQLGKQKMSSPNEKSRVVSPFCLYPVLINEQNGGVGDSEETNQNKSASKSQSRVRIKRGTEQIHLKEAFSPKQRSTPHSRRNKALNNEFSRSPKSKNNITPSNNITSNNLNLKSDQSPSNIINIQFDKNLSQSSIESSEVYNFNGIKPKQIQQVKQDLKQNQQGEKKKYFSSNTERNNIYNNNKQIDKKLNDSETAQQNLEFQLKERTLEKNNTFKKPSNQVIVYSSLRKSYSQQKIQQQQSDQNQLNSSENCIKKVKLFFKQNNQIQNNLTLQQKQNQELIKNIQDSTGHNLDLTKNNNLDSAKHNNLDSTKHNNIDSKRTNQDSTKNQYQTKLKNEKKLLQVQDRSIISSVIFQEEKQLDISNKSKSIPIMPNELYQKQKLDKKSDLTIKEISFQKLPLSEKCQQNSPNYLAYKNSQLQNKQITSINLITQQDVQSSICFDKYQINNTTPDLNLEKKKIKQLQKRHKKLDTSKSKQINDFNNLDPWEIEQCQDNYLFSYYNQKFCNEQL
ncbi:hypothetical protein TTHERM_00219540 (macronuclear) [Tetrahymena thermophila SB210]|uniref:Uncharacterized protein n=1 Tax=Tetrahymena thermophila (strain SB210) TaxID=312017 RepID=I7MKV4_TETTS|nr:hypothetical protein TTHERM_00219540 [Tetrahymena thermophila SB210]EAS00381.1 hypothetical protein TTHERM_00219540 [Tetrahymena thermophila SB210]|eukprot:XP_001020626.1 hypothetical protein TTHERM_00219540 [Tetrahymena thermophila SB210]